jgi:hypothetical protein
MPSVPKDVPEATSNSIPFVSSSIRLRLRARRQ